MKDCQKNIFQLSLNECMSCQHHSALSTLHFYSIHKSSSHFSFKPPSSNTSFLSVSTLPSLPPLPSLYFAYWVTLHPQLPPQAHLSPGLLSQRKMRSKTLRDTKEVFDGNGIMRHTFNNKCRTDDEMQDGHLNKSLDPFFQSWSCPCAAMLDMLGRSIKALAVWHDVCHALIPQQGIERELDVV